MLRFLAVLLVWWILTDGEASALAFGVGVAVLVMLVSAVLFPRSGYRLVWYRVPGFLWFFVVQSAVAGLDVARRLLAPSLPIAPGLRALTVHLPEGAPRWLLANVLSLLPGTLSVRLQDNQLLMHCLDTGMPLEAQVRQAERRVAALFGVDTGVAL
ncbi:MAG: Na+/H+ antiporter subunit E [Marinobacter sp.]|nr:Na+/H+ antiporter subunit E [Marinobacter sp.]